MLWTSQACFRRTTPEGRREIRWRTWVLVWVLPGLLATMRPRRWRAAGA